MVEKMGTTNYKEAQRYSDKCIKNQPRCCFEDASCEICCDPQTKGLQGLQEKAFSHEVRLLASSKIIISALRKK